MERIATPIPGRVRGGAGAVTRYGALMRVLIVEDDTGTADFIVKGLRQAGCTPDHAADGKEGLFLALEQPYQVIVLWTEGSLASTT